MLNVAVVSQTFSRQYAAAVKQYIAMLDNAVKVYRQDTQAAAKAISAELEIAPEAALRQARNVTWLDASEQVNSKNLGISIMHPDGRMCRIPGAIHGRSPSPHDSTKVWDIASVGIAGSGEA